MQKAYEVCTVKEIKEEEESAEPIEMVGSCAPEREC